jgi:tetratricopeptide (TPR) repeat protein
MLSSFRPLSCLIIALSLSAAVASGQEAGQADLDKATELRLSAKSLQDLERVAQLCDTAIKKGLDDENKVFATQLAAGALFDLASRFSGMVLDTKKPDQRWQLYRHSALRYLERAIKHDPELADAHLMIGRLHQLPRGDRKRSAKAAARAIELFEKAMAPKKLSKAYFVHGAASEDPKDQLKDFTKALELDASNAQALAGQAGVLLAQGKTDEALATFDKLLAQSDNKVAIHTTIAEALLGLERYDEAIDHATKAIKADEKSGSAYTLRARIHAMREDAKAALEDLNQALKVDPQHLTALMIRCELQLAEGKYAEARADVKSLLAARPGLMLGFQLRSRISAAEAQDAKTAGKKTLSRMKFAEAARDIRLLLRHDPNNHGWRLQLASIYSTDDQPRRAVREIEKVLSKDKKNWIALRTRADALLAIGDHKGAIADYEVALKIQPKHSGILNNLAWVLSTSPDDELRDGKRAIELAQKACEETDYKAAHILSTLASAYAEIGDFETAKKWSAKAVELDEDGIADQLQKELDSYKEKKKWRELQETKENPDFEEPKGDVVET